jgi:hypothetical protein
VKISFTRVTWYSQIAAIILFAGVYFLGFYVGEQYETAFTQRSPLFVNFSNPVSSANSINSVNSVNSHIGQSSLVNNVVFSCPPTKIGQNPDSVFIAAQFMNSVGEKSTETKSETTTEPKTEGFVDLELSDGRTFSLPQVISADGARYANSDQSFVFWNKGNGAFIEENGTTTYSGCVLQS